MVLVHLTHMISNYTTIRLMMWLYNYNTDHVADLEVRSVLGHRESSVMDSSVISLGKLTARVLL